MSEGIVHIKTDAIGPNPNNPRKYFDQAELEKLAQSIREVGILQPVLAAINGLNSDFIGESEYYLIAGERRWRAAQLAGLEYIPVVIKKLTPEQEAEIMLIENLQRKDLDPIEEAAAYKALLSEHDYTQEALGEKLGVSQAHIANRIRLLELPESVQQNISREIISPSHGRVLVGHKNVPTEILEKATETIASDNIPVAKTADVVRKLVSEEGMPLFENWQNKPQFKSGKGSDCYECERRAMGARWSNENEQPYCMNKECWEEKQAEAIQKKLKKAEDSDFADIDKLNYSQYEYWRENSTDYDQSECGDCAKRKLGKDRGSQYYCLDPACMKKKKTAMTKIKNKAAKDAFQVELAKITELAEEAAAACSRVGIPRQVLVYLAAQILAKITNDCDRKITRYLYVKEKFGWQDDVLKNNSYYLLGGDWDTFQGLLESLSDQQLWGIIFQWPAVAEGLKGIRSWMLEQVIAMDPEESESTTISVVTGKPKRCGDCGNLTDGQMCAVHGIARPSLTSPQHCSSYTYKQIEKDLDKFLADQDADDYGDHPLETEEPELPDYDPDGHGTCRVCGCTDDMACPGGCYWVEPDLCSRCAELPELEISAEAQAGIDGVPEVEPDPCGRYVIFSCARPDDACPHCKVMGKPAPREPHYPSCMGCEHLRWAEKGKEEAEGAEEMPLEEFLVLVDEGDLPPISAKAQADIDELLGDDEPEPESESESEYRDNLDCDQVHALIGRRIEVNGGSPGGTIIYVSGPNNSGHYTLNFKGPHHDKADSRGIVHGVTIENGIIMRYGEPFATIHEKILSTNYIHDGKEIFVSDGLWSGEGGQPQYGTFRQSGKGGLHRIKSPAMPMVATQQEAQANLDAWALKKGLKTVTEEPSDNVRAILEADDVSQRWKELLDELTDVELLQAVERENRPSPRAALRKEARRRKLNVKAEAS